MAERPTRFKPKKSVALSGVEAGTTALCTVGRSGNDLHYRGYDILDIADRCEFEELAHLLIHERCRRRRSSPATRRVCAACAGCPRRCAPCWSTCPRRAHPMDVMRTGCSALGAVMPETEDHDDAGARDIADRLIASFGSMLLYWYHYSHNRRRIDTVTDDDSIGGHFLHLLHGKPRARIVGEGDAHLAQSLRRARVQRLDLRRAGRGRHRLGHAFGNHRRYRGVARSQARRRERSRLRGDEPLPTRRTTRRPTS